MPGTCSSKFYPLIKSEIFTNSTGENTKTTLNRVKKLITVNWAYSDNFTCLRLIFFIISCIFLVLWDGSFLP